MTMPDSLRSRLLIIGYSCLVMMIYWVVFIHPFLPTEQGTLGHDHRGSLVESTIGYVHFQKSPFSIPWFTPASCAGNMYIAGAANPYINLQQWLTFAFDPLTATKISFMVFAVLGFVGCYLLCRRRFQLTPLAGLLGASLFLFNGFFAYRMIIGHTAFHSYMLVPLIACLFISGGRGPKVDARNILFAALLVAYMTLASGVYVLMTSALALVGILAIHSLCTDNRDNTRVIQPYLPLVAAFVVAMLLCLFKISLTLSTAANFERDFYPTPGLVSIIDAITLPIRLLFFSTPDWETETGFLFTNYRWPIERHELEMGIGLPALMLLVFGAVVYRGLVANAIRKNRTATFVLMVTILVPLVLNFYQPLWNELLKSLPVLRSFSLYVRLYAAYIPLAVLATVLVFNRLPRFQLPLGLIMITGTIAGHWFDDRSYYAQQQYKPDVLLAFYESFRHEPEQIPPISSTSELKFANFQGEATIIQNEMFVFGSSNIECHNDMFGYRLEVFPKRDLLISNASVFDDSKGFLNFKNPACYVFPEANRCEPGDHFETIDRAELNRFVQYKGMSFAMPRYQHLSNAVSVIALLLVIFGIIRLYR